MIRIATQVLTGNRGYRELPPVSTGQDGGFVYRAPRGPSRRILISYTPFAVDTQPAVVKLVRLKTRAGPAHAGQPPLRPPGRPHRVHGPAEGRLSCRAAA